MHIELKKLSINDDAEILEMIREIGPGENGFGNDGYDTEIVDFKEYLRIRLDMAKGVNLLPNYVPMTIYWLMVNNKPVGIGKIRHYLNDLLRENGGHVGYSIRPSERGKGYGKTILNELLKEAKEIGINEAFITCDVDNIRSRHVIEANKGQLEEIKEGKCKYWVRNL